MLLPDDAESCSSPVTSEVVVVLLTLVEADDKGLLPKSNPLEGSLKPPPLPLFKEPRLRPLEDDTLPNRGVFPSADTPSLPPDVDELPGLLLPGLVPPHATHDEAVSLLLTQQSSQVQDEEGGARLDEILGLLLPGLAPPHATHDEAVSLLLTQQSSQVHDEEGGARLSGFIPPVGAEEPTGGAATCGREQNQQLSTTQLLGEDPS